MKKKLFSFIGPAVGLVVFSAALWVLERELSRFHLRDILNEMRSIPASQIALAMLLTGLNYAVLTAYDMLGFSYIGKTLSKARIALASFIAYAFSNNLGFMSLSGNAIRFRLYTAWGLSALDITRLVSFISILTFWLGLIAICAVVFIIEPVPIPPSFDLPFSSIRFIGVFFAGVLVAYLLWTGLRKRPLTIRDWELEIPRVRLSLPLIITACTDWVLYGSVLYVLMPVNHSVSFMVFLSVILVAQLAGMLSNVPGGIGVFETAIILLMPGIETSRVIGILLVFRAIYYLMPLAIAALLFGGYELLQRKEKVAGFALVIRQAGAAIMPHVASLITFLSGAVLLFSGATPAIESRLKWLMLFMPLPVMEISHLLGSIVGMALLILAWGIYRRLDAAYHMVLYLFCAGIALSLIKGADYEEAVIILVMTVLFIPCRRHFYRKTAFMHEPFSPGWAMAIVLVLLSSIWVGMLSYRHVDYSNDLWWQFSFHGHASRFMRACVGVIALLLIFGLLRLLRGPRLKDITPRPDDLEKARLVVNSFPRSYAQLALLGDKSFLFNDEGSAFIMYAVQGSSWVAMGDPVGPREAASELLWEFVEICDKHNGRAVFYEVGQEILPLYLDLGMTLLKLGEEGRVYLENFNLQGSSKRSLRNTVNRLDKEGCGFEILLPEAVSGIISRLHEISDAWLTEKTTREKRFSLGFFSPEYIRQFPVAVVKKDGLIVAFANIWSGMAGGELSIDLMRYLPSAPHGLMDYLFIKLMDWGRQNGYRYFCLGMAPFSGFEDRALAPVWSKIGSFLFRHGENFYNFRGLRQYKEKFDPVWEPRYLAAPSRLSLPIVLKDISALVSGGVKGVIAK
ncbi:conserved membrane hypothetical protein [uncultured Desulfobacterium sp.]|uniref:Phosphatidylglycerol lysyltransferase n=1 Tax=uncultured Desulfobacterium sp. TaxID=201089 RepID=A0A445MWU7_9BACT|nr:conserved membrane hypothetical protein [uncultured Desulfobacterium sp.]